MTFGLLQTSWRDTITFPIKKISLKKNVKFMNILIKNQHWCQPTFIVFLGWFVISNVASLHSRFINHKKLSVCDFAGWPFSSIWSSSTSPFWLYFVCISIPSNGKCLRTFPNQTKFLTTWTVKQTSFLLTLPVQYTTKIYRWRYNLDKLIIWLQFVSVQYLICKFLIDMRT